MLSGDSLAGGFRDWKPLRIEITWLERTLFSSMSAIRFCRVELHAADKVTSAPAVGLLTKASRRRIQSVEVGREEGRIVAISNHRTKGDVFRHMMHGDAGGVVMRHHQHKGGGPQSTAIAMKGNKREEETMGRPKRSV